MGCVNDRDAECMREWYIGGTGGKQQQQQQQGIALPSLGNLLAQVP
jgi:hypothetical protein